MKIFFIEKEIFDTLAKSSANAEELFARANNDIRSVEYTVNIKIDEKTTFSAIQFTAPKKMALMVKSKQKYEDF
ncbi:hypothetical protein [Nitrosomonas sp. Nm34]|uniref:hypothetical protein n=1 Tax=Nitrosomonas sp. Nm34 TaxID=1881055 RepID=UPI000B868DBB|nr:hypothetical protein [Nitrosomonas sp. Nm34]